MRGTIRAAGLFVCLAVVGLIAVPCWAVIIRLTALAEVIKESTVIVTAKVETIDDTRPAMMLAVTEALKGKPSFKKLPVLLKGDGGAVRRKESPELLKRVAEGLPVVVFVRQVDKANTALAYTNGTWFSLTGTTVEGEVRWSFDHLEPYLQRTYKGTTAEMETTVRDALSGKKKPPDPDKKGKAGLGPEVSKAKKKQARRGGKPPEWVAGSVTARTPGASTPGSPEEVPVNLSVIPTVLVGGPLALLAMLFPAAFAGWKRWLVLLSTAGTNSTLFTLHWWFADSVVGTWYGSTLALWTAMTLINVLGLAWAWQRHLERVEMGEAPLRPGRVEVAVLVGISAVGIALVVGLRHFGQRLTSPEWLPVVSFIVAVWLGAAFALLQWLRGPRLVPALATEAVVLTGLVLGGVALAPALVGASSGLDTQRVTRAWAFRVPGQASISSSPLVDGDHVLVGVAVDSAIRPTGALYCVDRHTGQEIWKFNNDGNMRQVHSSPVVADGRVYIGEGFHQDSDCKVFCLDRATGKKLWELQTTSHTESTPAVVDGRVYIGAGDDGMYCLDARTGKKIWNFPGFHIDVSPVVQAGRVYVGCGIGDVFKTTMMFCLDAARGKVVWRVATDLPVWGRPVVDGGRVLLATGNGRLNEADERPAGAVLCLRADNGQQVWKRKLADGALADLSADAQFVYFGCRDGSFYCLDREDGGVAWRRRMGSPVVSGAAVSRNATGAAARLVVGSFGGLLGSFDGPTGEMAWGLDLAAKAGANVELISTPATAGGKLYVAVTLISSGRVAELYCYEEATTAPPSSGDAPAAPGG